jgi:hypothetical protein
MTQDIEKSFKQLSRLTLIAVGGSLIFALTVGLSALSFAEKQRQKIYVLDQGKSLLLALQTDAIMSKDVEIRDHVTRFHELMFTLSPQKQTIQENFGVRIAPTELERSEMNTVNKIIARVKERL